MQSVHSRVNVCDILNTRLYEINKKQGEGFWLTATRVAAEVKERFDADLQDCCQETLSSEGRKCCRSSGDQLLDSGLSQVVLQTINRRRSCTITEKAPTRASPWL